MLTNAPIQACLVETRPIAPLVFHFCLWAETEKANKRCVMFVCRVRACAWAGMCISVSVHMFPDRDCASEKKKMRKVCHLPTMEDKFEPVEVLIPALGVPIGGVKGRSSPRIKCCSGN